MHDEALSGYRYSNSITNGDNTLGVLTMDVSVTVLGALTALVVAIVLILRKVPPAYGMMIGALAGESSAESGWLIR